VPDVSSFILHNKLLNIVFFSNITCSRVTFTAIRLTGEVTVALSVQDGFNSDTL
jgi:hypothetical protein